MERRVVVDSSSNLHSLGDVPFASAPLKILVGAREFVDDESLDREAMLTCLDAYDGPSSTSCPNVCDWLNAFGEADEVFVVVLTSGISGGYNAALNASWAYIDNHPTKKVHVFDTKTTGPELEVIAHKIAQLIIEDVPFEQVVEQVEAYMQRTHLMFALKKVDNFAKNGRVNPMVAKLASMLDIRIVGQASAGGELQMLNKPHGEKRALKQLLTNMEDAGFKGGPVYVRHTCNPRAAERFAAMLRERYPQCPVEVGENYGLCSYYAEPGGLLIGFESE